MKNNNEDGGKSVKKITRIINVYAMVLSIVLVALYAFLRFKSEINQFLLAACLGVLYVAGLYLFQKVLERSRWRDSLEEANRECEEEEARKTAADEKPDYVLLAVIALFAFIYAGFETADVVQKIFSSYSEGLPIKEFMPRCADALTLLLCSVLISVIVYNVSKRRIFDRRNTFCIYGVGATIIFGSILQNQFIEDVALSADSNMSVYSSLLGIFIIFFGKLFDIAVRLKREQELTI